jgi:hypothetical protein
VTFTDTPGILAVTTTANPIQVPESGGNVAYNVVVTNTSVADRITVDNLEDDQFGNLNARCAPALPVTLLPGQTISCAFTRFVTGDVQDLHTNVATATGIDDDDNAVSASGQAEVSFRDIPSALAVSKTAEVPGVPQEGAVVSFTLRIENTGVVDSITLNSLSDSVYGDVTATNNAALTSTTCIVPQTVLPSQVYTCQFSAFIGGAIGKEHTNVVTARGTDDDGVPREGSASETVVVADPLLIATKRDGLVVDNNGDGVASPGDTIGYTIVIETWAMQRAPRPSCMTWLPPTPRWSTAQSRPVRGLSCQAMLPTRPTFPWRLGTLRPI